MNIFTDQIELLTLPPKKLSICIYVLFRQCKIILYSLLFGTYVIIHPVLKQNRLLYLRMS